MTSAVQSIPAHPLLRVFLDAYAGRFPPADAGVTVVPPPGHGLECSVAFTGHAVVATAMPAADVLAARPDGLGASMAPDFLRLLAGPTGWIGHVDLMLAAPGCGEPCLPQRDDLDDHHRVRRARSFRSDVRVFGDDRGHVTLGTGLAGRREISIEVSARGHGTGRSLLRDGLGHVPEGEPVFASVTPGNARALRAFLAAGFVPIGSEVLLRPARPEGSTPRLP